MTRKNQKGFTMIELMIVVAIIGILSAIALPKFADMLEKSREGSTKGNLGAMKSANSIYYGDYPGLWPSTLDTDIQFRYSLYPDGIPMVKVTGKYNPPGSFSPAGGSVLQVPLGTLPSGQSTGWKNYAQPAGLPALQGSGLLFAFLCRDDNGRCEAFDAAFRVDIFDIVAGWR